MSQHAFVLSSPSRPPPANHCNLFPPPSDRILAAEPGSNPLGSVKWAAEIRAHFLFPEVPMASRKP